MLLAVCWFVLLLFADMETEACREGLAHGESQSKGTQAPLPCFPVQCLLSTYYAPGALLKVALCCLCLYHHCLPRFWRRPLGVVFALRENPPGHLF